MIRVGINAGQIIAKISRQDGTQSKVALQNALQPHSNLPELLHC